MKKSILMLSALLALVVSGFCLQGCSSEYDDYATEEYGYYTEEEILAVKALGEKYGVNINIDENTYGVKKTLTEFEEEILEIKSLFGEYEILQDKESGDSSIFIARKKESLMSRTATRASESFLKKEEGSWSFSGSHKSSVNNKTYSFSLGISWRESTHPIYPGYSLGSINASTSTGATYAGTLRTSLGPCGSQVISFSGGVLIGSYTLSISQGMLYIKGKRGSFVIENNSYSSNPEAENP